MPDRFFSILDRPTDTAWWQGRRVLLRPARSRMDMATEALIKSMASYFI